MLMTLAWIAFIKKQQSGFEGHTIASWSTDTVILKGMMVYIGKKWVITGNNRF